jgi:hypothetical protein
MSRKFFSATVLKDIRRKSRKRDSAEETMRIPLEGLWKGSAQLTQLVADVLLKDRVLKKCLTGSEPPDANG